MIVIGNIGDQVTKLVWSQISSPFFKISDPSIAGFWVYEKIFGSMIRPWLSSQPLEQLAVSIFTSSFGEIGYNISIIFTVLLNIIIAHLYFKRFSGGYIFSLIFAFSSYFWIHIGVHAALMQIWTIPLFFLLYERFNEKPNKNEKPNRMVKNIIFLGIFLIFLSLISNYYAFFCFMILGFMTLIEFFRFLWKRDNSIKKSTFALLLSLGIGVLGTFVILFPYFLGFSFLDTKNAGNQVNDTDLTRLDRPFEDFVTFSLRPWYFFTPHSRSFLYPGISEKVTQFFKDTNNYLANDYFADEHAGSFYGYLTLIMVFAVFLIYIKNYKKYQFGHLKINIYLILLLVLLMFSLPPVITLKNIDFYTPNYLIFSFFSMFRISSRLSIFILFVLLAVTARIIEGMVSNIKNKSIYKIFGFVVLTTIILETYIPVKIRNYKEPPEEIKMVKEYLKDDEIYFVYPYGKTRENFFWLGYHKRRLLNPREFYYRDFDSEYVTENLVGKDMIQVLKNYQVKYLLLYKENISEREYEYFSNSAKFFYVGERGDGVLYRLVEKD